MGEPVALRPDEKPMPEPSAKLWAELGRLMHLGLHRPKEFEAEIETHRLVIAAHRGNSTIMRARGAEYDEAVALEREKWANWLEVMIPVIRMHMSGRK